MITVDFLVGRPFGNLFQSPRFLTCFVQSGTLEKLNMGTINSMELQVNPLSRLHLFYPGKIHSISGSSKNFNKVFMGT